MVMENAYHQINSKRIENANSDRCANARASDKNVRLFRKYDVMEENSIIDRNFIRCFIKKAIFVLSSYRS